MVEWLICVLMLGAVGMFFYRGAKQVQKEIEAHPERFTKPALQAKRVQEKADARRAWGNFGFALLQVPFWLMAAIWIFGIISAGYFLFKILMLVTHL